MTYNANARNLDEFRQQGSAHRVGAELVINGSVVPHYRKIILQQSCFRHHYFEVTLTYKPGMKDMPTPFDIEVYTAKYLLARLSIIFYYKDLGRKRADTPENFFEGIITSVEYDAPLNGYPHIILKGYSPTIMLDQAPSYRSFHETNLYQIVKTVTQPAVQAKQTTVVNNPQYTQPIRYAAQMAETGYNFLCRLAAMYGEWFYYSGHELHFGTYGPNDEVVLKYGKDTHKLNISTHTAATQPVHYHYDALEDKHLRSSDTGSHRYDVDLPVDWAVKQTDFILDTQQLTPSPLHPQFSDELLDRSARKQAAATTSQMLQISGETNVPLLCPGNSIKLYMYNKEFDREQIVTYFLATEVNHELTAEGVYKCSFKGQPRRTTTLAAPEHTIPVILPEIATIIENNDPLKLGRVRVSFPWQEGIYDRTDWIRVMANDAGSSDDVAQDRGMLFIPEKGDQVMVGFEYGHPDKPYVMGSLYHKKNTSGAAVANSKKAIRTRSGHEIIFDDGAEHPLDRGSSEDWSLTVRDKNGNEIKLDTFGRNLTLTSPETMTLNAKNVIINAEENITSTAGQSISLTAAENISDRAGKNAEIYAENIKHNASEDYVVHAQAIEETALSVQIDSTKEDLLVKSAKKVDIKSSEKVKLF